MIERIGNDETFATVSSVGATVQEFVCKGEQIVFPFRAVGEKMRGGIPICFPFFGLPPDSMKSFRRHGWLRHQELNLVDRSDVGMTSLGKNEVVFEGENEPTKEYPWRLKYKITAKIFETRLVLKLVTTRLKDGEYFQAPINPGFHPYFLSDQKNLVAPCLARIGQDVIANFPKESQRILVDEEILIRSGDQNVKMGLGGDFNHLSCLTLWSDNDWNYFCVEPVLTDPNQFAQEGGRFLKEGETSKLIFSLGVIRRIY
jgi:galactose mutarotase-like enzyme